jgi:HK97 family phage portal protein
MNLSAITEPIAAAAKATGRFAMGAIAAADRTISGAVYGVRSGWTVLMNRTRFDYKAEVGDPATNSIVGAVIGWIARNFPEAPVRIVKEGTTEIAYMPSIAGPGAMLRLLERPNRHYSGPLQWTATLVDWIVHGNAYWFKVRIPDGPFKGRVRELWWLPANMVEPRWPEDDNRVFISHYEYRVDGVGYRIESQDIVHFRNGLDPRNTRKGLSKLNSLLREIFTDDEAANFTASLLRNLGVPGVIIAPANTTAGQRVTTDADGIKTKFKESFGGDKRGEPMVLTAPSEIKVLSFNPQEMDLKSLRRIPEERVSGVLGVPAMVAQLGAGLERSSFTNYSEANAAAYTQGVIPDQRLFAADLEVQLLPEFADLEREALDIWFDWTKVSAMQWAIAQLWKTHESAATKGLITRADFKRATGQIVTDQDNVYVMPNNFVVVPVGGGNPPSPAPQATVERVPPRRVGGSDPLLLDTAAGEVRCTGCSKLLAEAAAPPYRIVCPRCKAVTEQSAPDAASPRQIIIQRDGDRTVVTQA